jgi:hypothetical protein
MLCPASKLATAHGLHTQTASRSLGALLGLDLVDEDHLDEAMDLAAEPASADRRPIRRAPSARGNRGAL